MELLKYIQNIMTTQYEVCDIISTIDLIKSLVNDFVNNHGKYPFMISLNVNLYNKLIDEICNLPEYVDIWSYKGTHIKYCNIKIYSSKSCGESSIRIK